VTGGQRQVFAERDRRNDYLSLPLLRDPGIGNAFTLRPVNPRL
jgi:hypothetical protein